MVLMQGMTGALSKLGSRLYLYRLWPMNCETCSLVNPLAAGSDGADLSTQHHQQASLKIYSDIMSILSTISLQCCC